MSHFHAGLTNPPSSPRFGEELPHPPPSVNEASFKGAFEVSWDPPRLTGGLSSLTYNITISYRFFYPEVFTSDTHYVVAYIYTRLLIDSVTITVVAFDSQSEVMPFRQLSETGPKEREQSFRLRSECSGKGNYWKRK